MSSLPHLHFLGIAGSFMAGVATIAKQLGYEVSGSDTAFYPPMGDYAKSLNIPLYEDYDASVQQRPADLYIIGNALSRGNPLVESILDSRRPFCSAPQWLFENVLRHRRVLAVSGTHGKTTTTALLTHFLEQAGYAPGFLLGGIDQNFNAPARLGKDSAFFVIEADEYDSAFFDKRPKFLHYHPEVLVINNLEFDHADIYENLDAIIQQFHYLLRTVPANGSVVTRPTQPAIAAAIKLGCYSRTEELDSNDGWQWQANDSDSAAIDICHEKKIVATTTPPLWGAMNCDNLLAAAVAAQCIGVDLNKIAEYCRSFNAPRRRLQLIYDKNNIRVFDDFAHHPTAIKKTIAALATANAAAAKNTKNAKDANTPRRIIAIFERRSNSMKKDIFKNQLAAALAAADIVIAVDADKDWMTAALKNCPAQTFVEANAAAAQARAITLAQQHDDLLLMSNGSFLAPTLPQAIKG